MCACVECKRQAGYLLGVCTRVVLVPTRLCTICVCVAGTNLPPVSEGQLSRWLNSSQAGKGVLPPPAFRCVPLAHPLFSALSLSPGPELGSRGGMLVPACAPSPAPLAPAGWHLRKPAVQGSPHRVGVTLPTARETWWGGGRRRCQGARQGSGEWAGQTDGQAGGQMDEWMEASGRQPAQGHTREDGRSALWSQDRRDS